MRLVAENHIDGSVTYELDDSSWVKFDARSIRAFGLEKLLKSIGQKPPCNRLNVFQDGMKIGTVPSTFHPSEIKSTSLFYEPRGGDFTFDGNVWIASRTLGPGDLEAVPGFVWDRGK